MRLAQLLKNNLSNLKAHYPLTPDMLQALNAIIDCRSPEADLSRYQCKHCQHQQDYPLSCGHRHCPQCQQNTANAWLIRQQAKLLPVQYFMITFTLPYQLRAAIWREQKTGYQAMFQIAAKLLKDFAARDKGLEATPGFTMVLHTHNRQFDYHPHLHVIITGGGFNAKRQCWVNKRGKYLFNETALAKVWRARILDWFNRQQWPVPAGIGDIWVVNCIRVGYGLPALKYLARYLYRGVLSEQNILGERQGHIEYQYRDSKTRQMKTRTVKTECFLYRVLIHVLPKGFHRCRDYGFACPNQKALLKRIQLLLHVHISAAPPEQAKTLCPCPCCRQPMNFIGIVRRRS